MGEDMTIAPFGYGPECVISGVVKVIMGPLVLGITKDIAEFPNSSSAIML
jgi:hypothetical protein